MVPSYNPLYCYPAPKLKLWDTLAHISISNIFRGLGTQWKGIGFLKLICTHWVFSIHLGDSVVGPQDGGGSEQL